MIHPAIRTLKKDLQRLREVRRALDRNRAERKADLKEVRQDKKQLERHRDAFTSEHQELSRDRQTLSRLRDAERARLDELDAQLVAAQATYDASIDPLTGVGDPALKGQVDALTARRADVATRFEDRIDATAQEVTSGASAVARHREAVRDTRDELKHDRASLARNERQVKHDRERIKNVRQRALKHLRPAEYRMGLKATNRARRALGLKPVDHLIRPGRRVDGYVNGVARRITVLPVGNGEYLRSDAARAYLKMQAAARRAGVNLYAVSGFRTMSEQQHLWALYQSGQGNQAAPPGYSNHQGGVAMDIGGVGNYGTRAWNWLQANAGKFGFRNTVAGEYWHWSYGVNG